MKQRRRKIERQNVKTIKHIRLLRNLLWCTDSVYANFNECLPILFRYCFVSTWKRRPSMRLATERATRKEAN